MNTHTEIVAIVESHGGHKESDMNAKAAEAKAKRRGPARVGTKVQIRLPEDTLERIDSCAADLGVSRAEYIRRALAEPYRRSAAA
jgi:predicted DNA binding CopG/RHH family protein